MRTKGEDQAPGVTLDFASPERPLMLHRARRFAVVFALTCASLPLEAGTVSRQHAETFARKMAVIREHGSIQERRAPRRTPVTQDEVNSWFAYTSQSLLPNGVTQPQVTIAEGRLVGQAIVDLDAVAKRRSSGGMLDPWSLLGGRLPVSVTGTLRTQDGVGRFEVESAAISGVPVPTTLLQELLTYYSRSPERPQGVRLDAPFSLPARIQRIEVGQGQAVVVQ